MYLTVALDAFTVIARGAYVECATSNLISPVFVVPSRSHCMPSSPKLLILRVPLSIRKYSLQLMPSFTDERTLMVQFLISM